MHSCRVSPRGEAVAHAGVRPRVSRRAWRLTLRRTRSFSFVGGGSEVILNTIPPRPPPPEPPRVPTSPQIQVRPPPSLRPRPPRRSCFLPAAGALFARRAALCAQLLRGRERPSVPGPAKPQAPWMVPDASAPARPPVQHCRGQSAGPHLSGPAPPPPPPPPAAAGAPGHGAAQGDLTGRGKQDLLGDAHDEALLAHHARTQLVLLRLDPAAPAAEHQAPPRPAPPPVPGARDAERRGAAGARSGRR